MLYWSIGRHILAQQQAAGWGDDIVGRIAEDLRVETGSARGFSRRNLFYMRRLATVWPDAEKVQTLSAQIGWSHHQVLPAGEHLLELELQPRAADDHVHEAHLEHPVGVPPILLGGIPDPAVIESQRAARRRDLAGRVDQPPRIGPAW